VLLPSSAATGRQKPYVLTALADIGTVYWRYDCVHFRTPARARAREVQRQLSELLPTAARRAARPAL